MGLTPSKLAGLLERHGADRILILGPPGIGKSTVIRDYAWRRASQLGLKLVDLSEAQEIDVSKHYLYLHIFAPLIRAEDLAFIAKKGGGYDWTLPEKLRLLTTPGARGLVFIDEITNVQLPEVQTLLFSMILDKRVAYSRLSRGVEVVAAGNTPEDSPVATPPPPPLLDRFRIVVRADPPSLEEWVKWMNSVGRPWDVRVALILRSKPALMYKPPRQGSLNKFPTPRSWSVLAWELAAAGHPLGDDAVELASMIVGPEAAEEARPILERNASETSRAVNVAEELRRGECRGLENLALENPEEAAWAILFSGVDPVKLSTKCSAAAEVARLVYIHTR